jgi:hypothetical protein
MIANMGGGELMFTVFVPITLNNASVKIKLYTGQVGHNPVRVIVLPVNGVVVELVQPPLTAYGGVPPVTLKVTAPTQALKQGELV